MVAINTCHTQPLRPAALSRQHRTLSKPAKHSVQTGSEFLHPPLSQTQAALPGLQVFQAPQNNHPKLCARYLLVDRNRYAPPLPESPPAPVGAKPMKFYFQILCTPTADTPGTTFILDTTNKRYLFGHAAEGTQRTFAELGTKFSSLQELFITGPTGWHNAGGLLGVILTVADAHISATSAQELAMEEKRMRRLRHLSTLPNKEEAEAELARLEAEMDKKTTPTIEMNIHGGRNITHLVATARKFIFRKGLPLRTKEYTSNDRPTGGDRDPFEQPSWSDGNIKVWAMPLKPTGGSATTSGTASPRKRSLDEFEERSESGTVSDQFARDQSLRHAVVSDMFNSSWSLDALVETPLSKVQLPATIFVRNPETKDLERYRGPLPGGNEPVPDINVLVRTPWPGATVNKLPPTRPSTESMCYVVRSHDTRGKFDAKKAKELKVPPGPDYSRLTNGFSVVAEDGKTVTPEMVLGPPRLGRGFAFMDIPTVAYLDDLLSRPEWKSPSVTSGLSVFVWILGPGVGQDPRFREFVTRMSHCKHIVSGTDYCPNYLAMKSAAGSITRLARLNSNNFIIPVHDNVTLPQSGVTSDSSSANSQDLLMGGMLEPARRGLIINIQPDFSIEEKAVVPLFDPREPLRSGLPVAVEQRMEVIKHRMKKPAFQDWLKKLQANLPGAEAEIFTLGTGSSTPSKYRNVSATLVHVPGHGYYLLDCGENTIGQLRRCFPPEELREVLRNLRMIWISHMHADHHLGTASVIKAWYQENYPGHRPDYNTIEHDIDKILREKRLVIMAEPTMIDWLEEYAGVEDYGFSKLLPLATYVSQDSKNGAGPQTTFVYRHCRADGTYPDSHLPGSRPQTSQIRFNEFSSRSVLLRSATGLEDARCVLVNHCRGAMAVTLAWSDGFKLSYSGDCRPSAKFAEIGKGSTVLIHEATFQNSMRGSALAKRHCTVDEALEVGRRMNAQMVLLTHFSQRYQKTAIFHDRGDPRRKGQDAASVTPSAATPDIDPDNQTNPGDDIELPTRPRSPVSKTPAPNNMPHVIAFDYMRLKVKDFPVAQAFSPACEKLLDRLERAAAEEEAGLKLQRQAQEAANAQKKNKGKKKGKTEERVAAAQEALAQAPQKQGHSAWSASESESGWEITDDESGKMKAQGSA
ncbi:hypothetical protein VTN49DRAFT_2722 [Thermomyces lanuginosus]|uniref:uncharacterized protein n=1 Tax=Thermomyces lanuginosus TaxID=5541 RepID=UPI0037420B7B